MGNKVLTIEIMTNQIKICVISKKQNSPKVYQTLIFETPEDCVEDGYIKDVKSLSGVMLIKLREANITVTRVIFTITSSKIVNREVVIPYVSKNKIQDILKINGTDYFPMDISDYNITYMILDRIKTKEEKSMRLLLLAAHNNLLNTYFELAKLLNLQIESIDYVGNSAFQLLKKQVTEDVCLTVLINEQSALINVISKGNLVLQRTIPYGYSVALESLVSSSMDRIADMNEAYHLLCEKAILNPSLGVLEEVEDEIATASLNKSKTSNKWYYMPSFREEITESLQYLISNIIRVADYYASKNPEGKIQKVYLCGLGAKFKGLDQLFMRESGIEVQIIDKLRNVNFIPFAVPDGLVASDFVSNIGAILQPVGMLPKQYTDKAEKKSNITAVAVIATLSMITAIVLGMTSNMSVKDAQKEQLRLQEEILALESIELVFLDNEKLKLDLAKIDSLNMLNSNSNEHLRELVEELEAKLPTNINVHSIRSSKTDFIMDVSVDSKETAAMVMLQLKNIEILDNVKTASITEEMDELGMISVKLSVTANYKGAISKTEEVQVNE